MGHVYKNILVGTFLAFLFFTSCENKEENSAKKSIQKEEEPHNIEVVSTAFQYDSIAPPEGFEVQEIVLEDTSSCTSYSYQLLVSKDSMEAKAKNFQLALKEAIHAQINYDLSYVDPCPQPYPKVQYEGVIGLNKISFNKHIISVEYIVDTYAHGGNHHNYAYWSFNYDFETGKAIEFEDFLVLKNKSDTLDFIMLLDQNQNNMNCRDIQTFSDKWDFCIKEKGIQFNSYSPWSCSLNYCFLTWEQMLEAKVLNAEFRRKKLSN